MFLTESLVFSALLMSWQYVKCQQQEFPINLPLAPISTFARTPGNSHIVSPQDMNYFNLNDQMNYADIRNDETNQNTNINSIMNMNTNRNLDGSLFSQSRSFGRTQQRRLKSHKPYNYRVKHTAPDVNNLLELIETQLPIINLGLKLPSTNDLPLQLIARRSAVSQPHTHNSDNEFAYPSLIKNILLKVKSIKNIIQDLEDEIIECCDTL